MSMLHQRKADLILISFERRVAQRVHSDGQLLRRFSDCGRRRLAVLKTDLDLPSIIPGRMHSTTTSGLIFIRICIP
jgi:hypothetical protein